MVNLRFCASLALILVIDQLSKAMVAFYNPSYDFMVFGIQRIYNQGAGFGILQGQKAVLVVVSLTAFVAVLWYAHREKMAARESILWGMLAGGIMGNLIDRLLRPGVIDFLDFKVWPVFNVADAAITLSIAGIILISWKKKM